MMTDKPRRTTPLVARYRAALRRVNAALRDAEALRLEMVETCEHPEEFVVECYTHRGNGHGGEAHLDSKFCKICRKLEFWNNGQWVRDDQLARDND